MAAQEKTGGIDMDAERYEGALRRFADTVLEQGRDRYGAEHSPLFVDGLHARTLEPVRWRYNDQTWVLSNFANQQSLMRLLDGLTTLTGEAKYRRAAEAAAGHMLEHGRSPSGLFYWGGHTAIDLETNRPAGEYGASVHELKNHHPYYELLWRIDPQATRQMLTAVWGGHIVDWPRLDYNRHAPLGQRRNPAWGAEFDESLEIPFETQDGNLSFANIAVSLTYTGAALAALAEQEQALVWAERLAYRWQQGKHPETGLGGGQVSYRTNDRARAAWGDLHPQINEANMVATYHRSSRYHTLPLSQMQAGLVLLQAGGPFADAGQRFIDWALEDLRAYGELVYDPEKQVFRSMITDGTMLKWDQVTDGDGGYYLAHIDSLAPAAPDGRIFWSYALAYRLSKDPAHWRMSREMALAGGYGDIGRPDGDRKLVSSDELANVLAGRLKGDNWLGLIQDIYAVLELHDATGDRALLGLACGIADALLERQAASGLFPRTGREYAQTGDELPLAILHVAGALAGQRDQLPRATPDSSFFHVRYSGPLQPHQQKPGDSRTMDHLVFYGR